MSNQYQGLDRFFSQIFVDSFIYYWSLSLAYLLTSYQIQHHHRLLAVGQPHPQWEQQPQRRAQECEVSGERRVVISDESQNVQQHAEREQLVPAAQLPEQQVGHELQVDQERAEQRDHAHHALLRLRLRLRLGRAQEEERWEQGTGQLGKYIINAVMAFCLCAGCRNRLTAHTDNYSLLVAFSGYFSSWCSQISKYQRNQYNKLLNNCSFFMKQRQLKLNICGGCHVMITCLVCPTCFWSMNLYHNIHCCSSKDRDMPQLLPADTSDESLLWSGCSLLQFAAVIVSAVVCLGLVCISATSQSWH